MKVGIIVYSLGNHTWTAAQRLQEKLLAAGHQATLERVEMVGPARANAEAQAALKTTPTTDGYDIVLFGSPVRGGTIAPPMRRYLEQLPSLQGKRVVCFMTHFFRREWGANQALAQMKALCESKGAVVAGVGDARSFGWGRKRQAAQMVDALSGLLAQYGNRE